MVYVYWDKEEQDYRIRVPMQKVGKAFISVVIPPDETIDADRYVHVADIHSHNSMRAFFSGIDDKDELATRVYMVVGRLDQPTPEISARISNGGRFLPIDPSLVVETMPPYPVDFPEEWTAAVSVTGAGESSSRHEEMFQMDSGLLDRCMRRFYSRAGNRTVLSHEI